MKLYKAIGFNVEFAIPISLERVALSVDVDRFLALRFGHALYKGRFNLSVSFFSQNGSVFVQNR